MDILHQNLKNPYEKTGLFSIAKLQQSLPHASTLVRHQFTLVYEYNKVHKIIAQISISQRQSRSTSRNKLSLSQFFAIMPHPEKHDHRGHR